MKRSFRYKALLAGSLISALIAAPGISVAELPATETGMAEAPAREGLDALQPLGIEQLDSLRGRNVLTNVQSIQDLDATVSGSSFSADVMTTGGITIEQHALDNFEGVGIFNLFTGHNNAVDAAVGISVFLSE